MKKILIASLLMLLGVTCIVAQPIRDLPRAKKLKLAQDKIDTGDAYSALEIYQEIADDDKQGGDKDTEVMSKIADLEMELRDYKEAEKWYGRLAKADKKGEFPLARFAYARTLKMNQKFDEATTEFNTFSASYTGEHSDGYKKLAENEVKGIALAKAKAASDIMVETAGAKLNSPSQDVSPLSVVRDEMYFASLATDSVINLDEGDEKAPSKYFRIFKAKKTAEGWAEAVALGSEVNKPGYHTGSPAVSADKNTLYYSRCVFDVNRSKVCKIFKSNISGGAYSEGEQLPFNSNIYSCKNACSAKIDGKEALFFSSNMEGGQGGFDIWYVLKNSDGTFGTPLNAGNAVNTFGDEDTPFFYNGTMYFSSTGHPGMGGYDIFKTNYKSGSWSAAENLGAGYNSNVDDMYFSIGEDPCYGFLVTNRTGTISMKKSSTCCDDIFTVTIPSLCPAAVQLKSFDKSNNNPLSGCTVTLFEGNKKIDEQTNVNANTVTFNLERNKDYRIVATRNGYIEGSTTVSSKNLAIDKPANLEAKVLLDPIPANKVTVKTFDVKARQPLFGVNVVLYDANGKELKRDGKANTNEYSFTLDKGQSYKVTGNKDGMAGDAKTFTEGTQVVELYLGLPMFDTIYYDFDKSNIRPDAAAILENISTTLKTYPGLVVEVGSHTDAKGTDPYNDKLSAKRTQSAIDYLSGLGIDRTRLVPASFGEHQPAAPNTLNDGKTDYPDGRQRNRRTVFKIVRGLDGIQSSATTPTSVAPTSATPADSEKKNSLK